MKLNEFATRQACNDGIKLPLADPLTGKDSGEWVLIRGVDSDCFRKKEAEIKRRLATIENVEEVEDDLEAELLSSLIIEWSLEDECTEDNKFTLCKDAPLIAQSINTAAAQRSKFLRKKS